jgi:hypothetical protein
MRQVWLAFVLVALASGQTASSGFAPFAQWQVGVRAGDAATIAAAYSTDPPPTLLVSTGVIGDIAREASFWGSLKKQGLISLEIDSIADRAVSSTVHQIGFEAGLHLQTARGPQSLYLFVQQTWALEAGHWRIISGGRSDLSRLKQPLALTDAIFSKTADAHADIAAALARAAAAHKRVLLDFGGNWCYDCHVLDMAFHRGDLAPLLRANYELVNVDVEDFNYNLDIVKQYGLTIDKGVPMLAVLDDHGKLLVSSQDGSFESARALGPDDIIRFLNAWKPS